MNCLVNSTKSENTTGELIAQSEDFGRGDGLSMKEMRESERRSAKTHDAISKLCPKKTSLSDLTTKGEIDTVVRESTRFGERGRGDSDREMTISDMNLINDLISSP
jgi:phage FluMu protein Com